MEEFSTDAPVETDAACHVLDIGANLLAQIRHLIDEGDLCREKRVGRVLDELGTFAAGKYHRGFVKIERPVDFAKNVARARRIAPRHDAVPPAGIAPGRALAKEVGS